MAQSQRMVDALKQALKARGVSYAQVGDHLGLSLSSVKRLARGVLDRGAVAGAA